jgi:serine/threonine protein kinase
MAWSLHNRSAVESRGMTPAPEDSRDPQTCFDRQRLAAFITGNLPPAQMEALARHLDNCPSCTALLAELAIAAKPFLAAASRLDPAFLAAPELQRMIEKAKRAPSFLSKQLPERLLPREPIPEGYSDLEPLSGRPTSRIYRAHRQETGQVVVIRFVPAVAIASRALLARCMRAAQAAASATNGHVLPIIDVLPAGDSIAILVPFVEGTSLDRIIQHRRLLLADASDRTAKLDYLPSTLAWLDQLIGHVGALHAAGLRYPEIRPSSVLIDSDDVVWLTDFVLARLLSPTSPVLAVDHVTVHDTSGGAYMEPTFRIGHPAYVAPEEWSASARPDARADVFRLGVAAYQALTLRLPFHSIAGEKKRQAAAEETLAKSDVPIALQDIIRRALSPKPDDRQPSAVELAAQWQAARGPGD